GIERPVYDLAPILKGVAQATSRGAAIQLTICCREPEWRRRPADYDGFLGTHVRIVHNRTRRELLELYAASDIAVMPYGTLNSDWAMPIKFAEAIGMEKPVVAGAGTAVGRTVTEQGIGWVVGGGADDLADLIARINKAELDRVRTNLMKARPSYSWTSRAEEIASIPGQVRPMADRDP